MIELNTEWISVIDRLPKPGTMCKCKNFNEEFPAIYASTLGGEKKFVNLGAPKDVTHWKPIHIGKKNNG